MSVKIFVHRLLGGGENIGKCLRLPCRTAAEHVLDLLCASSFSRRRRVIQEFVGAHIQRSCNVSEDL